MTMFSTMERPAQSEEAGPVPTAEAAAAPTGHSEHPPTGPLVSRGTWNWVDVEERETPRATAGWMTLFAWAKTAGGW